MALRCTIFFFRTFMYFSYCFWSGDMNGSSLSWFVFLFQFDMCVTCFPNSELCCSTAYAKISQGCFSFSSEKIGGG